MIPHVSILLASFFFLTLITLEMGICVIELYRAESEKLDTHLCDLSYSVRLCSHCIRVPPFSPSSYFLITDPLNALSV
jgi:hypothetical protein